MTSRSEPVGSELVDLAATRIKAGEWPWNFFCWPRTAAPGVPVGVHAARSRGSGDRVGLAVRCPVCGKVSVNLVSRAHVDVPFVNDREVGVVQHLFEDDAAATIAEFHEELWSAAFDARRLGLSSNPLAFPPTRGYRSVGPTDTRTRTC